MRDALNILPALDSPSIIWFLHKFLMFSTQDADCCSIAFICDGFFVLDIVILFYCFQPCFYNVLPLIMIHNDALCSALVFNTSSLHWRICTKSLCCDWLSKCDSKDSSTGTNIGANIGGGTLPSMPYVYSIGSFGLSIHWICDTFSFSELDNSSVSSLDSNIQIGSHSSIGILL